MLTVTALNLTDGREGRQLSLLEPERPRNRKTGTAGTEPGRHPQKIRQDLHRPGNFIKNDIGLEDIEIEEKP